MNNMGSNGDKQSNDSGMSPRTVPFELQCWHVDPAGRQLRHLDSGEIRTLEPRLMRLLGLLAAAPGQVLGRDALIDELWPRVVVNENSLTRAVSELRRKLEVSSNAAPLIDTIPKTGYRLSAQCRVRECRDGNRIEDDFEGRKRREQSLQGIRSRLQSHPLLGGAMSLALSAVLVLGLQGLVGLSSQAPANNVSLADINLSNANALDLITGGRVDTASVTMLGNGGSGVEASLLNAGTPVVSSDGRLFAVVRYNEEGSSLLLGSTDLPNSPVTVLSTHDTIYNLQWSPLDRALLFAQSPRMTPAALLPLDERASLVMFDLDTFQTKVLQGHAVENDSHPEALEQTRGFKLTALARHFDWLS